MPLPQEAAFFSTKIIAFYEKTWKTFFTMRLQAALSDRL
jgi:hypothetical protein